MRGINMKIYTLENKNEILTILTHKDNMSYREFKNICLQASQEAENDFYSLKDILVNDYNFSVVEACGGFEVSKKRGAF
jgi:hypothetical protein